MAVAMADCRVVGGDTELTMQGLSYGNVDLSKFLRNRSSSSIGNYCQSSGGCALLPGPFNLLSILVEEMAFDALQTNEHRGGSAGVGASSSITSAKLDAIGLLHYITACIVYKLVRKAAASSSMRTLWLRLNSIKLCRCEQDWVMRLL